MSEPIACPCCKNEFSMHFEYLNEFSHEMFDSKNIVVCENCGFGAIGSELSGNDLTQYYRDVYRAPQSPMHIEFRSLSVDQFKIEHRSFSQILLASTYFEDKDSEINFLDIGAGDGQSFQAVQSIFQKSNLYAIEENEEAKKFYQANYGVQAFGSFDHVKNEFFDIILMSHSLEHFQGSDLVPVLNKIFHILKPGGLLLIEVPHVDLRNEPIRKYRVNDTPHTCFFSVDSLRTLIANNSQFKILFLKTSGMLLKNLYTSEMSAQRLQMFRQLTGKSGFLQRSKKCVSNFLKRFTVLRLLNILMRNLKQKSFMETPEEYTYSAVSRENIRLILKKEI